MSDASDDYRSIIFREVRENGSVETYRPTFTAAGAPAPKKNIHNSFGE
ncbi:hypothetical protein HMPREF1870_00234 [Bacteroidales bacterium KA00344]|nr:hypothetical protein HMPREF1870_00234 [Bacteroidales bacterium KA00344]